MILKDSPADLDQTAQIVRQGGVIAFRTDTVYGLGADPFNQTGIEKIKTLKGREEGKERANHGRGSRGHCLDWRQCSFGFGPG